MHHVNWKYSITISTVHFFQLHNSKRYHNDFMTFGKAVSDCISEWNSNMEVQIKNKNKTMEVRVVTLMSKNQSPRKSNVRKYRSRKSKYISMRNYFFVQEDLNKSLWSRVLLLG